MAVPSLRASRCRSTRYGRRCAIPRPPLEGSNLLVVQLDGAGRFGTSIVLVPLHNPLHLAKEVATLQELSGGRFTLGVGMGWHRHEFDFMGVEFKGRGRRADEAIRLMRALWSGERDFEGEFRSFHDATSEPHPSPYPEIWVGGSSECAIRRALEWGTLGIPRAAPTRSTSAALRSSIQSYA
jgi:alkanesulfonate monooxygenase SsuD/methylene tetrahydromethanopterin reductase-like flavin-dependent oxidoreductase (luciferase family)